MKYISPILVFALSVFMIILHPSLASEQATSKGSIFLACSQTQQKNNGSEITFKAKTNRQKYKIGDTMTLSVVPDKTVLVTIIDHGSDPMNPKRNNFLFKNVQVEKGQTYTFPESSSEFDMQVSGPAGGNTFEIIASPVALTNPDAISRNVNLVRRVKPTEAKQLPVKTTSCMLTFEITE